MVYRNQEAQVRHISYHTYSSMRERKEEPASLYLYGHSFASIKKLTSAEGIISYQCIAESYAYTVGQRALSVDKCLVSGARETTLTFRAI